MLTCTLAISLAPVSAYAAPGRQPQTAEASTEAGAETEAAESLGLGEEDAGSASRVADTQAEQEGQEGHPETEEGQGESGGTGEDTGASDGASTAEGQGGGAENLAEDPAAAKEQDRITAERIQAEKKVDTAPSALEDDSEEEDVWEEELDDEEERPIYTAPEDSRHANASFAFLEAASSAYFKELTYPVSVGLKEVDTGDRVTLTIRSSGQILEVEKGDYAIISVKDSGKVPLSVPGDTLHIYENTEYQIRFAANNALKMFTDFLMDNIFLACLFACAALLYKKVFIPMFANDVKRR